MSNEETVEERARNLLARITAYRGSGKDCEELTLGQQRELMGVQQALPWALDPEGFMHPMVCAGVPSEHWR